ncbi:hypothetical protein BDW62DRAFT_201522 [Aspergillus aurantiobrunneus]
MSHTGISPGTSGLFLAFLTLASTSPVSSPLQNARFLQPTDVAVMPSLVAGIAENTHTSTVGPNGLATPVPVVGGPECWFCPGKSALAPGSWALLGIDGPGIYQPSSDSPVFSAPLPIINVSSTGDPSYDAPSKTTPSLSTRAKRVDTSTPVPTETHSVTTGAFEILLKYLPEQPPAVRDGTRMAMTWRTKDKIHGVPVMTHWGIIAGPVIMKEERVEVHRDCGNGERELERVEIRRTFDWDAPSWDLAYYKGSKKVYRVYDTTPVGQWRLKYRDDFRFKYLGTLPDTRTAESIDAVAQKLIDEMNERGGYSFLLRNCRDFAYYLYKRIRKDPAGDPE